MKVLYGFIIAAQQNFFTSIPSEFLSTFYYTICKLLKSVWMLQETIYFIG